MEKIRILEFIIPKAKYGVTSVVATGIDYLIFFLLVDYGTHITVSQAIAYSIALLFKFFILRIFVFHANRSVITSFQLVILFSAIGFGLSTGLVHILSMIPFFKEYLLLMKILVTVLMFFYNFYTKRYAFEGKSGQEIGQKTN